MIGHDPRRIYDAAIIGAGSGGLTLAIGLAGFGRSTVLIEGDRIGGDCTNVGCIPSKSLLHAARTGIDDPLDSVRARRDDFWRREEHEVAQHRHIHLVRGWARLTARRDPHVVTVEGPGGPAEVRARNVVIAGGSRPLVVPVSGLPAERTLTNESLFELSDVPRALAIIGGGAIALETATAFRGLGAGVDIVEREHRLLPRSAPLVSSTLADVMSDLGVGVHVGVQVERAERSANGAVDLVLSDGTRVTGVDHVMMAAGRRPRTEGLDLDLADVRHDRRGVVVDDWGRTSVTGIWAVGDVTGVTMTTHGANALGRRIVRAIALPRLPRTGRSRAIPDAVFTEPEVAEVGLAPDVLAAVPAAARRRYVVPLAGIDRGFTDEITHGFVAVDVERFTGRVLRATIVGPSAAELIGIFTLAIDRRIGIRKLFGMVHPYPTHAEAIGRIADDFARDTYPRLHREVWAAAYGRLRGTPDGVTRRRRRPDRR